MMCVSTIDIDQRIAFWVWFDGVEQCSTYYCTKYGACIGCPANVDQYTTLGTTFAMIAQCRTFGQCAQYDDCVGCPAEVVQ